MSLSTAAPELPWVEKYRPKKLSDVVGNTDVVEAFKRFAQDRACPNLLLEGPPGVGKTTCVKCLAHELWGKQVKDYVLVLNASDDRGVNVVREKIKQFAMIKCPSKVAKIVILDEADSMTLAAQQSLRRIMEQFSETTRFAFAVNDLSKMLEAIQSRCGVLHFKKLSDDDIIKRLITVCKQEGVKAEYSGLEAIAFTSNGDMRPALNHLQTAFASFDSVTESHVYAICDVPHPATLKEIVQECIECNLYGAYQRIAELYEKGYASADLVTTMVRIVKNIKMDEEMRTEFLKECAVTHMRVLDGLTGKLQLASLLGRLCQSAKSFSEIRS